MTVASTGIRQYQDFVTVFIAFTTLVTPPSFNRFDREFGCIA